jgi:hypothetical protein
VKEEGSAELACGVCPAGDGERPNRPSRREDPLVLKSGTSNLNPLEGDSGMLNCDLPGGPNAEVMQQHTTTYNPVNHNEPTLQTQYCQLATGEIDESRVVSEFAASAQVTDTGMQLCTEIFEEQIPHTAEVSQQPTLRMSLAGSSSIEPFIPKIEQPVEDNGRNPVRPAGLDTIDHGEAPGQKEVGDLPISLHAEVPQHDQLEQHMIQTEEEDNSVKKEAIGADVAVLRKAIVQGSMFERSSSSGEVADAARASKESGSEVSKQNLLQLQHGQLDHLLDMVEVGGQEISCCQQTPVSGRLSDEQCADHPAAVNQRRLNTITLENHNNMNQISDQPLPFTASVGLVSNAAKRWVPSADSSAVLGLLPKSLEVPLNSHTTCQSEEVHPHASSDNGVVLPYGYESPLSILRSCRILPQFSDKLRLSRDSITWSHSIDPFKPLCKFEHRGKCNNDDCPWQHADDYTLSSSQVESQIQNCVDLTGLTSTEDAGPVDIQNLSTEPLTSSLKWNCEVPVYFIGSYTVRAEDLSRISLYSHDLQLGKKVDSLKSFLLSPSIRRPLPSDIPCLLKASETSSWFTEAPVYQPDSPHWRYMRDVQEKLSSSKVWAK